MKSISGLRTILNNNFTTVRLHYYSISQGNKTCFEGIEIVNPENAFAKKLRGWVKKILILATFVRRLQLTVAAYFHDWLLTSSVAKLRHDKVFFQMSQQ